LNNAKGPICRIHKEPLKEGQIPIIYGLFHLPTGYFETMKTRFPQANNFAFGGCVTRRKKYRKVKYCEACRNEYLLWQNDNKSE
jgi:hypothetical protein